MDILTRMLASGKVKKKVLENKTNRKNNERRTSDKVKAITSKAVKWGSKRQNKFVQFHKRMKKNN